METPEMKPAPEEGATVRTQHSQPPGIAQDRVERLEKEIVTLRRAVIAVLIVLALLLLGGTSWSGLPGVAAAAGYLHGLLLPLPRAKGDKFTVAIARLENDNRAGS